MKKFLITAAAALGLPGAALTASAQPVGVSIDIAKPGVYGRINIGAPPPPPALVLPQPVVIAPPRVVVPRQPIYLYVPQAHQRDWRRYCSRYAACGQPVYFVRDSWVRERYEHSHPGWDRGRHRGWDDRRDHRHDRWDDRRGRRDDRHDHRGPPHRH